MRAVKARMRRTVVAELGHCTSEHTMHDTARRFWFAEERGKLPRPSLYLLRQHNNQVLVGRFVPFRCRDARLPWFYPL